MWSGIHSRGSFWLHTAALTTTSTTRRCEKSAIHKFKETNKKKELCASGSSSGLLKKFARVHWQQESHMVIDIPASVVAFLRNPAPRGEAGPLNLLSDNRFRAAFCATQSETHFWCVFSTSPSLSPRARLVIEVTPYFLVSSTQPLRPSRVCQARLWRSSTYLDEKLTSSSSSLVTLGNSEQSVQNKTRSKKTKPASCVCATFFCAVRNSFGSKIAALIKKRHNKEPWRALSGWLVVTACACVHFGW